MLFDVGAFDTRATTTQLLTTSMQLLTTAIQLLNTAMQLLTTAIQLLNLMGSTTMQLLNCTAIRMLL